MKVPNAFKPNGSISIEWKDVINMKFKKLLGIIFMIVGIAFIAYPMITGQAVKKAQSGLASDWDELNQTYGDYDFDSEQKDDKDLRKVIDDNDVVGKLHIPKIDLDVVIAPGVDQETLQYAVGWMPSTALPNEKNNTVLAAHRSNTYGKFFNRAGELEIGDQITVETLASDTVYEVDKIKKVDPTDLSVLEQTGESRLTLITCGPFSDEYRLIIHAKETKK